MEGAWAKKVSDHGEVSKQNWSRTPAFRVENAAMGTGDGGRAGIGSHPCRELGLFKGRDWFYPYFYSQVLR